MCAGWWHGSQFILLTVFSSLFSRSSSLFIRQQYYSLLFICFLLAVPFFLPSTHYSNSEVNFIFLPFLVIITYQIRFLNMPIIPMYRDLYCGPWIQIPDRCPSTCFFFHSLYSTPSIHPTPLIPFFSSLLFSSPPLHFPSYLSLLHSALKVSGAAWYSVLCCVQCGDRASHIIRIIVASLIIVFEVLAQFNPIRSDLELSTARTTHTYVSTPHPYTSTPSLFRTEKDPLVAVPLGRC